MLEIINYTSFRIDRNIFRRAMQKTLRVIRRKKVPVVELIFISSRTSRLLNGFRKKYRPANVLSFPEKTPLKKFSLGQIFLTPSIIQKEAKERGIPQRQWFAALFTHGLLHLLGFDHKKKRDWREMNAIEERIWKSR